MKDVEESLPELEAIKPSTPRLVLILLVLNLAATGFVAFEVVTAEASGPAEPVVAEDTNDEPGPLHTMAPFVVNLNDLENPRFLKTTIDIEVRDPEVLERFDNTRVKIVRDDVMLYLSGLKLEQIMGETGKVKVKEQILARLQSHFKEGDIRKVLLSEFVVQ